MTAVLFIAVGALALFAIKHHGPTDPPRRPHPMKEHRE